MTKQQTIELALGRIFNLASRPAQAGDIADYERCRSLILNAIGDTGFVDHAPCYARDRLCGAQGD
jgi:hypothetical protein